MHRRSESRRSEAARRARKRCETIWVRGSSGRALHSGQVLPLLVAGLCKTAPCGRNFPAIHPQTLPSRAWRRGAPASAGAGTQGPAWNVVGVGSAQKRDPPFRMPPSFETLAREPAPTRYRATRAAPSSPPSPHSLRHLHVRHAPAAQRSSSYLGASCRSVSRPRAYMLIMIRRGSLHDFADHGLFQQLKGAMHSRGRHVQTRFCPFDSTVWEVTKVV